MFKVGLTGPMGSGKSFATKYFREAGIPVYDADAIVHGLYGTPEGIAVVEKIFGPITTVEAGQTRVDRKRLGAALREQPELLPKLEDALAPLILQAEADFTAAHAHAPIVVYDIPLMYERGGNERMDTVVLMDAPESVLYDRVMARDSMKVEPEKAHERYAFLKSKFIPQNLKKKLADYIIDTGGTPEQSQRQLDILFGKLQHRAAEKDAGHSR